MILNTRDVQDKFFNLCGIFSKGIQIIAEYLYSHILSRAGHKFVETHLDRLLEFELNTGKRHKLLFHLCNKLLSCRCRCPFLLVLKSYNIIACFHRCRVGRYLTCTDLAHCMFDLREIVKQYLIGTFNLFNCIVRRGGRG